MKQSEGWVGCESVSRALSLALLKLFHHKAKDQVAQILGSRTLKFLEA